MERTHLLYILCKLRIHVQQKEQGEPLQQSVRPAPSSNAVQAEEWRGTQGEPLMRKPRCYQCAEPMMIHAFDILAPSLWQPQQQREMALVELRQGKPLLEPREGKPLQQEKLPCRPWPH